MRYPLPYTFARSHRLLLEAGAQGLTLWLCSDSDRSALSEVTVSVGGTTSCSRARSASSSTNITDNGVFCTILRSAFSFG